MADLMQKQAVTDPWQMFAIVAKAAQDIGMDVELAFRFMGAFTLAMAAKNANAPASSDKPQ